MAILIVNICKKLSAFWLRIFSGWYPAVKIAEGTPMRSLQIGAFIRNLFQIERNQELVLKNRISKPAKPPP